MKQISYYILTTFCAGMLFTACQQKEDFTPSDSAPKELFLSDGSISDREEITTRANGNTFFADKKEIRLFITQNQSSSETAEKVYAYNQSKGIFSGKNEDNKFYFTISDDYISNLVVLWPADRKKEDKPTDLDAEGKLKLPTDQRTLEEYRKADWLTTRLEKSGSIEGIMPTDTPVPMHFERNNARLEFEVQGQNAYGQNISSLILELQLKIADITDPIPTAFWAYCNTGTGHAEVILPGGSRLTTPKQNYMIGRIAVAGKTEYTGTVVMPEKLDIELKPNTSYKVTLTPRGDNLIASIHIGGFGQDEEGIGLPFQLPTVIGGTNIYEISNASQLMTLSYILREYKIGSTTTAESDFDKLVSAIDWKNQKYKLKNAIDIPGDLTWKPVARDMELPKGNFDQDNHDITQNGELISFFK